MGFKVGDIIGAPVGFVLGNNVLGERVDGCFVCFDVGLSDGCKVGCSVVITLVGAAVGYSISSCVGSAVGCIVGFDEGA